MPEPINEIKAKVDEALNLITEARKEMASVKADALTEDKVVRMMDEALAKLHEKKELTKEEIMKLATEAKGKEPTLTDKVRFMYGLNVRKEAAEAVQKEFSEGYRKGSFIDSAVNKATALAEGTQYYGNELVIPVYAQNLIQVPPYNPVITGKAYQAPLNKGYQMIMPYITTEMSGAWETEASAIDQTDIKTDKVTVAANKRMSYIYLSNELLEDESYDLDQVILYQAKKDSDKAKDEQILCGSTPFTGVYSQVGTSQQVAAKGVIACFEDIYNLARALDDDYVTGGEELFMRRKSLFDLMFEKDEQKRYIWSPPEGGRPATIWMMPYNISTQVSKTLGTGADKSTILLGDPKNLFEVERQPLVVRKADQLRILNDQTVIVTRFRWACETKPNIKGWSALTGLPGGTL